MPCAALRARSMTFSSAESVMLIAEPMTQHSNVRTGYVSRWRGDKRPTCGHPFPRACWGLRRVQCRAHPLDGARLQQVGILAHQNVLAMALGKKPHIAMAAVACLHDHTFEVAHQSRQVGMAPVQHEVIVIAYQEIGQHQRVKALQALLKPSSSTLNSKVAVVLKNRLAPVAAGGVEVVSTGEIDAQGAGHGCKGLAGWEQKSRPDQDFAATGKWRWPTATPTKRRSTAPSSPSARPTSPSQTSSASKPTAHPSWAGYTAPSTRPIRSYSATKPAHGRAIDR